MSVGLHLDDDQLNLVRMNKNYDIIGYQSVSVVSLDNKNVKLFDISKKECMVSGIEAEHFLTKEVNLSHKNAKRNLKKIVAFQIQTLTSIDPQKAVAVTQFLSGDNLKPKLLITSKDILKNHLHNLQSLGVDPEIVTTIPNALFRFASHYLKNTNELCIFHLALAKSSCIVIENGLLKTSLTVDLGVKNLISCIPNEKQVDLLKLDKKKQSALWHAAQELKKETSKLFYALSQNEPKKFQILITGEASQLQNLEKFLLEDFSNIEKIDLNTSHECNLKKQAISIGLALDALAKDHLSLQFRQKELASKKILKGLGQKIFYSSLTFILITLFLHLFTKAALQSKENNIKINLVNFQKTENRLLNQAPIDLTNLSLDDNLALLEQKIQKESKTPFYFSKAQKVSKAIEWINNHPLLKDIEVLTFKYDLEKFPHITNKNEDTTVKIEFEFKATAMNARKFHEALLKENNFINSSKEIKWEVFSNSYKVSFYLKTTGGL
ncbi:MAG: hypothetical protein HZB76_03415 [Chlamydiae bacterium]|nr:hypothetical protein [Chlamydiota bacterium]